MENWKKTFGIIWSGQLASILSSSVVGYAIIFWMSIETGSAEVLALAAIAGMLPQSLLGPFVGVYVDRWDRKRTMILADSFIAFCTLILAVLFWFDVAQMWHIYTTIVRFGSIQKEDFQHIEADTPDTSSQKQAPYNRSTAISRFFHTSVQSVRKRLP